MSAKEISRLVKALSELGACKIRLTGEAPTVRKDFFDILKDMKQNFCKIYYLNQNFEVIKSSLDRVIA